MTQRRSARHPADRPGTTWLALLLIGILAAAVACEADPAPSDPGTGGPASAAPSTEPSNEPSPEPSDLPSAPAWAQAPTACFGLAAEDCARARALAGTELRPTDRPVRYIHVGPFGCATGERCAGSLALRPEGDVLFEFDDGSATMVHLKVAVDGAFEATRGEAFGVVVAPTSPPVAMSGPAEFALGHCGLWSGIDFDGSWWDPVGPIGFDSGEAINATAGVIVLLDPDHATFSSPGGLVVQLLRRPGERWLPFCQ